jgi:hypothetical protein
MSRVRSHAAITSSQVSPQVVCAHGKTSSPPMQALSKSSCAAHKDVIPSQADFSVDCSASSESRVLFHWSGMDVSQVVTQRDKAVHNMTSMSYELEKTRCELRCVHAQLRNALDAEDELTDVKAKLRMMTLQRARAVAVSEGAAEHLSEAKSLYEQMLQHLDSWQSCNDHVLESLEISSLCVEHRADESPHNVLPLVSELQQSKDSMQKMSAALRDADTGTVLMARELRDLRKSDGETVQGAHAYSVESFTSEQRRLYQVNCERLKAIQALQTAARRSRAAAAAVLERLVCRGQLHSAHLRNVLLSWRVSVARKILSNVQLLSIQHATALVQRHTEKVAVWLKRTVFIGWCKQLWLSVHSFPHSVQLTCASGQCDIL